MFRAFTKPVNSIYGRAGAAMITGDSVLISGKNAAGEPIFQKPTSDAESLLATYKVYLDTTIYNDPYNGVRNAIASGMLVQAINGALKFECDAEHINQTAGAFSSLTTGDYFGQDATGKFIVAGSASTGTTKFYRFESYVGNTSSGILVARMETML